MSDPSPAQNRARTKIIATVGPACRKPEQLADLVRAGVDVFRLNMAHGEIHEHAEVLASIRKVSSELRRPIGVLVDLAGPKIRLGELPGGQLDCRSGDTFYFIRGDQFAPAGPIGDHLRPVGRRAARGRQHHAGRRSGEHAGRGQRKGPRPLQSGSARPDPQPAGPESARRQAQRAGHGRRRPRARRLGRRPTASTSSA